MGNTGEAVLCFHTRNNVVHMRKRLKNPLNRVSLEMVMTPWGESGSLRERRLQPIRGASQDEVETNQRERLFAALIASVAERGYAATTVASLVDLSGVSSRSFYDQFGDMQGCMRQLVGELLKLGQESLEGIDEDGGLEAEERRRFRAFAELVASQPGAAKVLLSEAAAAGPDALAPMEKAFRRYERSMGDRYDRTPERRGMPEQLISAIFGGMLEIARRRLRLGREGELADLEDQVVPAALAYRPPPVPLRLGSRQKWGGSESLEAADHSDRAIRAFAVLCSEKGYPATTVDDVVKLASMSSRTFYAHFASKEDLMKAAIDSACAQLLGASLPAFSRHEQWPAGVRAGIGAMLGFLASRPALARLLVVESYVAGDFAIEQRSLGLQSLGLLFENNTTEWQLTAPIVYELIAGGMNRLVYLELTRGGPQALPALAPMLSYVALAPFLGPEEASEVANGGAGHRSDGSRRAWVPAAGGSAILLREPMVALTLTPLLDRIAAHGEGGLTVAEIAAEIDKDPEDIAGYLRELAAAGVIDAIRPTGEDEAGGSEIRYRGVSPLHQVHIVTRAQTAQMDFGDREAITEQVRRMVDADLDDSIQAHLFDQRSERFYTRTPMRLDEQGWLELAKLHGELLHAGFEIRVRSAARLEETGEEPIEVRSVQILFEMPPDRGEQKNGD